MASTNAMWQNPQEQHLAANLIGVKQRGQEDQAIANEIGARLQAHQAPRRLGLVLHEVIQVVENAGAEHTLKPFEASLKVILQIYIYIYICVYLLRVYLT